jgi:hypothetical protein
VPALPAAKALLSASKRFMSIHWTPNDDKNTRTTAPNHEAYSTSTTTMITRTRLAHTSSLARRRRFYGVYMRVCQPVARQPATFILTTIFLASSGESQHASTPCWRSAGLFVRWVGEVVSFFWPLNAALICSLPFLDKQPCYSACHIAEPSARIRGSYEQGRGDGWMLKQASRVALQFRRRGGLVRWLGMDGSFGRSRIVGCLHSVENHMLFHSDE